MKTRQWGPGTLAAWRPDRKAAAEVERDIDRIVGVAARAGYSLPRADAELVWLAHSAQHCATWLILDNVPDDVVLRIIEGYTRKS
jgi:hypothetical protein